MQLSVGKKTWRMCSPGRIGKEQVDVLAACQQMPTIRAG